MHPKKARFQIAEEDLRRLVGHGISALSGVDKSSLLAIVSQSFICPELPPEFLRGQFSFSRKDRVFRRSQNQDQIGPRRETAQKAREPGGAAVTIAFGIYQDVIQISIEQNEAGSGTPRVHKGPIAQANIDKMRD
jgi:hypothetical protein